MMNRKERLRAVSIFVVVCLGALAMALIAGPSVLRADAGNVVVNGDFENGVDSWRCKNCNDSAGAPAYSGSASGQIVSTTSTSVAQLFQKDLSLEPNANYTLSFYAKSPDNITLKVSVLQGVSPRDNYGLRNELVTLTGDWQLYTISFTSSGFNSPVTDGQVQFKFPRGSGLEMSIDNIVLTTGDVPPPPPPDPDPSPSPEPEPSPTPPTPEPPPPLPPADGDNAVSNGGFENGVTGWQCKNCDDVAGPPAASGNAAMQVISTKTNAVGQLFQNDITLQPNATYELSFYGRSPDNVTLKATVLQGVKPRDNYGLRNEAFNLGPDWQLFSVVFTTSGFNQQVNDARLQFKLPKGSGFEFSLDEVRLITSAAPPPPPPPPPPPGGTNEIRIFHFDDTVTASGYSGFVMDKTSQYLEQNWVSPVDFAGGRVYTRAEIISIPKNQPDMKLGWCFWQRDPNKNLLENCKGNNVAGVPGTVETWSYALNDMWKKGGKAVDYSQPRLKMGFIIRDGDNDPVSLKTSDNWGGNDPNDWYPMRVKYTVVLVAKGATFSGWQNYP